jgi:pentatricopeptide repeat protein
VGVAAIDMYAKCGSLEKAHQVFEMLPAQSLVAWTALLLGSVQCGHAEEGLHCFEQMKLQGILPDAITFTCALKACGSIGALCKGMEIHDDIIRHKGMIGNPIIGNALIDMYAKCGVLTRAQGIFNKLLLRDTITWNTLLTGYSRLGEIENIVNVLYEMNANGIKPELIAITSVLNACCHAGLVDGGHMFFNYFFKDQSMIPTIEHFTCMIDLCGRAGQLESALGIMKNAPCYPNMFTWVAVIGACRKWGNAELAMSVFKHALPLVENEVGAYICMINIYEQEVA